MSDSQSELQRVEPLVILVVEDDEETQRFLALTLGLERYSVMVVGSVEEAAQILASQPLSLVVPDWDLPDGTAALVCEAVHEVNRKTPILLLSGKADLRTIQTENLLVDLWLTKPTTVEKLLGAVQLLLKP